MIFNKINIQTVIFVYLTNKNEKIKTRTKKLSIHKTDLIQNMATIRNVQTKQNQ